MARQVATGVAASGVQGGSGARAAAMVVAVWAALPSVPWVMPIIVVVPG